MAQEDPDPELAEASADLWALDPGDFVAARNDLARRLRKDGKRELAGRVAELRRPSPAAWAVNQLTRRHPAELEGLLRLGEALRSAQTDTLGGADAEALRQAARTRRDAAARLADLVMGFLAERGSGAGAHHAEVAATLEAASLDPHAAVAVAAGRLTSSLEPPSGFGELGSELPSPQPSLPIEAAPVEVAPVEARGDEAAARSAEPGPNEAERAEAERAEAERAEAERAEAEREAAETAETARERSTDARDLLALVAQRRREVDEAEEALTRVQRRLDEVRRYADAAERQAAEAGRAAEAAEVAAADATRRLQAAKRASDGQARP